MPPQSQMQDDGSKRPEFPVSVDSILQWSLIRDKKADRFGIVLKIEDESFTVRWSGSAATCLCN